MPYAYAVNRFIDAPPDVVFDVVSDHAGYVSWTPVRTGRLLTEGTPDRNGVGARRFLGVGRVGAIERVVEFDRPAHMSYVVERGLPTENYRAHVRLSPSGNGTALEWSGSFDSAPPLLARPVLAFLKLIIRDTAKRLAAESVRRSRAA